MRQAKEEEVPIVGRSKDVSCAVVGLRKKIARSSSMWMDSKQNLCVFDLF